jgi:hypothetical protein
MRAAVHVCAEVAVSACERSRVCGVSKVKVGAVERPFRDTRCGPCQERLRSVCTMHILLRRQSPKKKKKKKLLGVVCMFNFVMQSLCGASRCAWLCAVVCERVVVCVRVW